MLPIAPLHCLSLSLRNFTQAQHTCIHIGNNRTHTHTHDTISREREGWCVLRASHHRRRQSTGRGQDPGEAWLPMEPQLRPHASDALR